jgi:hypothetical protein
MHQDALIFRIRLTEELTKLRQHWRLLVAQTSSVSSIPVSLGARVLQEPIPVAQCQRNNIDKFICRFDVHL